MRSLILLMAVGIGAPAQTLTTLVNFDGAGAFPGYGSLVEGANGRFYGETTGGGFYGMGTLFEMTAEGDLTVIHSFAGSDGSDPNGGLMLASGGYYYGTTSYGGANGFGTLFQTTAFGFIQTEYSFDNTDGANPIGGLVEAFNGKYYGTTSSGVDAAGGGTVFEAFAVTTVHDLTYSDGDIPLAGLVQGRNGLLYGAATGGGAYNRGAIFTVSLGGSFQTVYSFGSQHGALDGDSPAAALVEGSDGNFYGTTERGGEHGYGTVFRMTPEGAMTILHSFDREDGSSPAGALIQGSDGNLYGTTTFGGPNGGKGTVFEVSLGGGLATLHTFSGADGANPFGGLVQGTNGNFYGTTSGGGSGGRGTIFQLSTGLGPLLKTVPWFGAVGGTVWIVGDVSGASSVTFGGVAAEFTVMSRTQIRTTVPAGAVSGVVEVVTPGGVLASAVVFQVL